ncbi:MAG: adenylate/guanylate cyclase domain-containing protein [Marinibacterium sp.]
MADDLPTRRLSAILSADIAGYSTLMAADEDGTLRAVTELVRDDIAPLVVRHGGRIVKLMGDGVLAEFGSVLEATRCAVAWHERSAEAGGEVPLSFRIGINLGDVLVQGDDIFGEGVNIAARLESLADPGGICLSGPVYDQVHTKLDLGFARMSPQTVKGVADPIRVYKVAVGAPQRIPEPALPLPEKPSIAIMPFDNMSGEPEQVYLADGISEDLITALSRVRWLFVTARNSTFTYKGKATDVKQVGRELGVRYVLEGSVRRAGSRVRVTAQLIDAASGVHVWAERYDRDLTDIFDLQDEMTQTIIGAVEPEISAAERARFANKPTGNLDAWESFQRGVWHMWTYRAEDNERALVYLERAAELDPGFSTALGYRAYVHYQRVIMHWAKDFDDALRSGMQAARQAIAADERDPTGHFGLGRICMMMGRHDDSIAALETAIGLNPSFAQAYHGLSMVLCLAGEHERSREAGEMCERLSPRDPILWATLVVQALNCLLERDFEAALGWATRVRRQPNATGYWPHAMMAAPLAQLGRIDEARSEVAALLQAVPHMTVGELGSVYKTRSPGALAPYLDGLRLAGLPE